MTAKPSPKKRRAQATGRWSEYACRLILALTGWTTLHHGYRAQRGTGAGEIDLIAKRRNTLAFIEVKARQTLAVGLESVSSEQQNRIIKGADRFLASNPQFNDFDVRFDVMIVRPWHLPRHFSDVWRP